jgi:hypothetical protein
LPITADPKRAVTVTIPRESVLQRSRAGSLVLVLKREDARRICGELLAEFKCSVKPNMFKPSEPSPSEPV